MSSINELADIAIRDVFTPRIEKLFAATFGDSWREVPEAERAMEEVLSKMHSWVVEVIEAELGVGWTRH